MRMFFENVNLSELLEQLVLKTKIHSTVVVQMGVREK